MARKFRILSIDGGGLRGIVPATILQKIEDITGKKIYEMFDLIAGSSTGGLIACALTVSDNGLTPKFQVSDIAKMYTDKGPVIFPQLTAAERLLRDIEELFHPMFRPEGLDSVIKEYMGDKTMKDCLRPLFITSYDIKGNEAVIFKSRNTEDPVNPLNPKLHDICRATSAAPTFLPAYTFNYDSRERVFVDGGMYMNNPSVGAIVEISRYARESNYYNLDGNIDLSEICVLSLGTGHYINDLIYRKISNAGALGWIANVADLMMQGVVQTTTYESEELLDDGNYLRLDIKIDDPAHDDMTDSSATTANYLIRKTQDLLNNPDTMKQLTDFLNKIQEGPFNV